MNTLTDRTRIAGRFFAGVSVVIAALLMTLSVDAGTGDPAESKVDPTEISRSSLELYRLGRDALHGGARSAAYELFLQASRAESLTPRLQQQLQDLVQHLKPYSLRSRAVANLQEGDTPKAETKEAPKPDESKQPDPPGDGTNPLQTGHKWEGDENWSELRLSFSQAPMSITALKGTFIDKSGRPGTFLLLSQSGAFGRYQGEWECGETLKGRMMLRFTNDGKALRGSWTTNPGSKVPANHPDFSDFEWVHAAREKPVANPTSKPGETAEPELISDRLFHVEGTNAKEPPAAEAQSQLVWVEVDPKFQFAGQIKVGQVVQLSVSDLEPIEFLNTTSPYSPHATVISRELVVKEVLPAINQRGRQVGVRLRLLAPPSVLESLRKESARDGGSWKKITHVVKLSNVRAQSIVDLLQVAFPGGMISADTSLNAVILRWAVRDSLGELQKVETAIKKLDIPGNATTAAPQRTRETKLNSTPQSNPAGAQGGSSSPEIPMRKKADPFRGIPQTPTALRLVRQLQEEDSKAASLAADLRKRKPGISVNGTDPEMTQLKQQVEIAFDQKLQLEELQVQELRARLNRLETQIELRRNSRQKIVELRTAQLYANIAVPSVPLPLVTAAPAGVSERSVPANSVSKSQQIVVDLYGGKNVLPGLSKNVRNSALVQRLNSLTGVVTNFRETKVEAGDKILMAMIHDPSGRARQSQAAEDTGADLKSQINAALQAADVSFRWEESIAASDVTPSADSPPKPNPAGVTAVQWTGVPDVVVDFGGKKLELGIKPVTVEVVRDSHNALNIDLSISYPLLLGDQKLVGRLDIYPSDAQTAKFLMTTPLLFELPEKKIGVAWDQGLMTTYSVQDAPAGATPNHLEGLTALLLKSPSKSFVSQDGSVKIGPASSGPFVNPLDWMIREADERGTIVAVLRLGRTLNIIEGRE